MLEQATEEGERIRLQKQLTLQLRREAVGRRISLARDEIVFGLAAHILDKYIRASHAEAKAFFDETSQYLPSDVRRLTSVFERVNDHRVADYWGWSQWDAVADGQARYVDTHTKPNQLYCVQALRLLEALSAQEIERINLAPSESLSFLSADTPQGLPHTLEAMRAAPARWQEVVGPAALNKAEDFLLLLRRAKEAQARVEHDELIVARLDAARLQAFKDSLHEALQMTGVLKPLFRYFRAFEEHKPGPGPAGLRAWGFNQLDDKGPYVIQSRVSYPAWGQGYGRSLGHAEDQIGFSSLRDYAAERPIIFDTQLIAAIENFLSTNDLGSPILVHTLVHFALFDEFANDAHFISRYRNDSPVTPFDGMSGFIGLLRYEDMNVPVFRLFVQDPNLQNKAVLVDLPRFAKWDQYVPMDGEEDSAVHFGFPLYQDYRPQR